MIVRAKEPATGRKPADGMEQIPPELRDVVESSMVLNRYPSGALLFTEGDAARGAYVVLRGRVKLSVCASDGKTLIVHLAGPGELLGAASVVSQREHEATAEALEPSDVGFLRQADVLRLMRSNRDFSFWVTQQLSENYNSTCREIRNLMLSDSASEKLARLLVGWLDEGSSPSAPLRIKLSMTHEEMAQMIGTSRETVTRLLAGFKKQRLIEQNGSTLVVPNRGALESLITQ